MTVLGIDPGASGAMVFMRTDGSIWHAEKLPRVGEAFDLRAIAMLTHQFYPALAVIERVAAMPGQGVTGMFRFGEGYGMLQSILAALNVPYALVTPQTWRKEVGLIVPATEPRDASMDAKALARAKAARTAAVKAATVQQALARWPSLGEPLRVKARWGIADAAFLAECARKRSLAGAAEGAA